MNYFHRVLCSSAKWKEIVQRYALPWTLEQIDLGGEVLEIGPGYGAATEVLQRQAKHLVCVESDRRRADRLRRRFNGRVAVEWEDATAMSFARGILRRRGVLYHAPPCGIGFAAGQVIRGSGPRSQARRSFRGD